MLTARLPDGKTITAIQYGRLPDHEKERLKGNLRCPDVGCAAVAHYRRRSIDGKPALFYSDPHTEDCPHKTRERNKEQVEGDKNPVAGIENTGERIRLIFDSMSISDMGAKEIIDKDRGRNFGRRHDLKASKVLSDTRGISMERFLRLLIDDESFQETTQNLVLPDGTAKSLSEICFRSDSSELYGIAEQTTKYEHDVIIWGNVYSVNVRDSASFINLKWHETNKADVGILLDQNMHNHLLKKYELEYLGELSTYDEDYYGLVIGRPTIARNGKVLIRLKEAEYLAFVNM